MDIKGHWINERGIWVVISDQANREIERLLRAGSFFYVFYPDIKAYEDDKRKGVEQSVQENSDVFTIGVERDGFGTCDKCGFRMYFLKNEVRKACPHCKLRYHITNYIERGKK